MDRKTNVFFIAIGAVTVVAVILIFYRAFVSKDYTLIPDPGQSSQE
jgi:hypothetical protein